MSYSLNRVGIVHGVFRKPAGVPKTELKYRPESGISTSILNGVTLYNLV